MKDIIKFYPVGNADMTLIKLSNKTTIMIDCQFSDSKNEKEDIIDHKLDIKKYLETKEGKPFIDYFILTHPHRDHSLGFSAFFHIGEAEDVPKDKVIIDEIWVTQMIFSEKLDDSASDIRKEANRRKRYSETDINNDSFGNKLKIVGYDNKGKTIDGLHIVPGDTHDFSEYCKGFIHAPFKDDLIDAKLNDDKNQSSIVIQFEFKTEKESTKFLCGGDAEYDTWKNIVEKTEKNKNGKNLQWDIFLSPHHCSYSFFGDKQGNEPEKTSIKLLEEYAEQNSTIIASSKEIEDNDDNPPSYKAMQLYKKYCSAFKNTATNKNGTTILPIEIVIENDGHILKNSIKAASIAMSNAVPPRAG